MVNLLIGKVSYKNAIRFLDTRIQNTFRYLSNKKIKQISETNTHNALQKRHQHNLKQIKIILEQNNLRITKADKGRTMIIIHTDTLKQKIYSFIQENQIMSLDKDPTELFENIFNTQFTYLTQ